MRAKVWLSKCFHMVWENVSSCLYKKRQVISANDLCTAGILWKEETPRVHKIAGELTVTIPKTSVPEAPQAGVVYTSNGSVYWSVGCGFAGQLLPLQPIQTVFLAPSGPISLQMPSLVAVAPGASKLLRSPLQLGCTSTNNLPWAFPGNDSPATQCQTSNVLHDAFLPLKPISPK